MDEADYPGVRVALDALFDKVRTPFKIDISTGDAITPREIRYIFRLMFEDRFIEVLAYNLETVLAEKLETVISRASTNTRMRDFMISASYCGFMDRRWTRTHCLLPYMQRLESTDLSNCCRKQKKFLSSC